MSSDAETLRGAIKDTNAVRCASSMPSASCSSIGLSNVCITSVARRSCSSTNGADDDDAPTDLNDASPPVEEVVPPSTNELLQLWSE